MRLKKEVLKQVPREVIKIVSLLNLENHEAYAVGGCVRDIIIGKTPHDYDICTSATPDETESLMRRNGYIVTTVGKVFGTIVVINKKGEEYEITTFRTDVETSGKHRPDEVAFTKDIKKDLSRRDFTINAMALNVITGEVIDEYEGIYDIKYKIIRAVGNADDRMQEDPLRMLRAVRFAIVLGYNINENVLKAIINTKELINNVSKERITEEFRKIFKSGKPIRPVFLETSDLISEIIPEIKNCIEFNQNNRYHIHNVYEHILYVIDYCKTTDFSIKMAALFHDIAKPEAYVIGPDGFGHFYGHPEQSYVKASKALSIDFKLTHDEYEEILTLVRYHDIEIAETYKSVKRVLNKLGPQILEKWFILKQADRDDHIYPDNKHYMNVDKLREMYITIMKEKQCFTVKDLNLNGNDIMQTLKIKPGKVIGTILEQLLMEVIDGELNNNKVELIARAAQIYNSIKEENNK